MDSSSRPRARHAAIITACAAAYVLLSLAALAFANGPASLPVFRPANGFLVGCLFVTPARRRAPYLAAAFAAGLAVRLSALPWGAALGYGLADLAPASGPGAPFPEPTPLSRLAACGLAFLPFTRRRT